jgi:DNA (cytosine-5)-methyltransferase 1
MAFAPKVLDLFCGAGGMSLGFENAGCRILGGIEFEKWPAETHKKNFPDSVFDLGAKDIREIEPEELGIKPGEVDILIGGPPCQGFSIVGRSKIRHLGQERERDIKNRLYRQYIKFLKYFKPKYFVIENVDGMKNFKNQKFLPEVITELEKAGYLVNRRILVASDYGVPQTRHRLFIIGRRKRFSDLAIRFPEPLGTPAVTVDEAISDLRRLDAKVLISNSTKGTLGNSGARHEDRPITYRSDVMPTDYQLIMRAGNGNFVMNHICRGHNEKDLEIFSKLKQGGKYMDLPKKDRRYRDDIFKDKYRKLKASQPSWTLTAHMQRDCLAYIHPRQRRSISTREAARLQSFPDRFVFVGPLTKVFRQIGNAVPPLMAQAVAREIVLELQNQRQRETETLLARA